VQGTRNDFYKYSKQPRLSSNQNQHNFNLHHRFETSKLPCSTISTLELEKFIISKCLGRIHVASQCQYRRTMILRDKDEYSLQEEETSKSEENKDKISEKTYPCEAELLMIKRNPDNQSSPLFDSQREHVFHTR